VCVGMQRVFGVLSVPNLLLERVACGLTNIPIATRAAKELSFVAIPKSALLDNIVTCNISPKQEHQVIYVHSLFEPIQAGSLLVHSSFSKTHTYNAVIST